MRSCGLRTLLRDGQGVLQSRLVQRPGLRAEFEVSQPLLDCNFLLLEALDIGGRSGVPRPAEGLGTSSLDQNCVHSRERRRSLIQRDLGTGRGL